MEKIIKVNKFINNLKLLIYKFCQFDHTLLLIFKARQDLNLCNFPYFMYNKLRFKKPLFLTRIPYKLSQKKSIFTFFFPTSL